MVGIVTGAVVNIVLDPLLIFTFGMGISGAALATIISQMCSFSLLLYMARRGNNIIIRYKHFTPTWRFFKEIIDGGTPSLFRQGLASGSTILLNVRPVISEMPPLPGCLSSHGSVCSSTLFLSDSDKDSSPCADSITEQD